MTDRSRFDPGALFRQLPPVEVSDQQVAEMQQRVRVLVEHQSAQRRRAASRPRPWLLAAAACALVLGVVVVRSSGRLGVAERAAAALTAGELAAVERLIEEWPLIEEIEESAARVAYHIAAPPIDVVVLVSSAPAASEGIEGP